MTTARQKILQDLEKYQSSKIQRGKKSKVIRYQAIQNDKELCIRILKETSFLSIDAKLDERIYCIANEIYERLMCPVCHVKPLKFAGKTRGYYMTGCSKECSRKNPDVKEQTKQRNLIKYGYESPNSSPDVKAKKEASFLRNHGVTNPSYMPEVIEKRKKTSLKNNGTECALSLKSVRKQRQIVSLTDSYNNYILKNAYDEPMFTLEEYLQRTDEKQLLKFRCKKCHRIFETWHHDGSHSRCPYCYKNGKSFSEVEIQEFLKSLCENYIIHEHIKIFPLELDIYIPSKKLAIEFDGLYWHSDDKLDDPQYHLNKTERCEEKGIQLIHIFENEWLYKQDIVKSRLKNLLGIYDAIVFARKCEVREVTSKESKIFQEANHIQGAVNAKVHLGLYYGNELISLMTFGKCRFNKNYEWELLRFCNKLGYHVPGAAGKLLKHFEKTYNPMSLISYADRRWSIGKLYEALGFTLDHASAPNYWYWNRSGNFLSRLKCQKHKLQNILDKFDPLKTELENMLENKYHRIFDCGNLVYTKIY